MNSVLRAAINRFPRLKRILKRLLDRVRGTNGVSANYVPLAQTDAGTESQRLRASWQSDVLPARQREVVDPQLASYRSGKPIDVFDVMIASLRGLPDAIDGYRLLEIGCSSGFYSEVLNIAGLNIRYAGCDYSAAFIREARRHYPDLRFDVEDATSLGYPDAAFDIVVSGCCLLHIPEYQAAVAETARVASRYVIFHRTPVVWGMPEQWFRKEAYGVETVEIHFNESEFMALLERHGLALLATHTLHEDSQGADRAQGHAVRTYVCRKIC